MKLITDFAMYALQYKDVPIEQVIKTFFRSLSEKDQIFFAGCWEICVGSAEMLRNAPETLQKEITG